MSNFLNTTRVIFSGKTALIAAIFLGFAISAEVQSNELTPSEETAVKQHFAILEQHQQASEMQIINDIQANLDALVEQAEEHFMETACDEYDRQYDNDFQVCYE
ncbi:hypothetical protein [Shewanella psychrotolerans]|uniref:hypothetical protein n=1 Tax=Shewanella psychrotolerans TaxID=2864206 RepID=UPI001C6622E0|nr:hypothetical protein [Shewanella psychrotolerans]QYK01830.1 hypothetical protein K0I62_02285 [Shewanella psychrotolerans]